jgi:hypothetical protein
MHLREMHRKVRGRSKRTQGVSALVQISRSIDRESLRRFRWMEA